MSTKAQRIAIALIGVLILVTAVLDSLSRSFGDYASTMSRYKFVLDTVDAFNEEGIIMLPDDDSGPLDSRMEIWHMAEKAHQMSRQKEGFGVAILVIASVVLIVMAFWSSYLDKTQDE